MLSIYNQIINFTLSYPKSILLPLWQWASLFGLSFGSICFKENVKSLKFSLEKNSALYGFLVGYNTYKRLRSLYSVTIH